MSYEFIKVAVEDFIATVTLDNPPRNAQSPEVMEEIAAVFDEMSDRDDVRVVILTGAGKAFSAGVDMKRKAAGTHEEPRPGDQWRRARLAREKSYAVLECKKPVITAVNGPALGAGLGLAVMGDIILASEEGVFGLPEIDVGLAGGARHAMRIFPHSLVRRMALTGYRVTAEEAYRRGIIEACLPAAELMPFARDMARQIAEKSPVAVLATKDSLFTIEHMTIKEGYRYEQNNTAHLAKTEDAKEAMRAFAEKRKPVFQGR
ncbi:enoyl-CoA hydratase/isomerase family protein [Muricoccus radiodurans]|uniref:enoyl-CoA hydratase/isomerase family protein n=1 Tax=Muricoccus radiodurans TaxID=2231721 RepID=UPI003CFBC2F8